MSFAVNKELGIMCKLNRPVGIDEEKKEPGHPNVLSIRELYVFFSVHLSLSHTHTHNNSTTPTHNTNSTTPGTRVIKICM